MDCREYLERLCWQKLVRDKIFKKFLVTKDLELILDLEKKYQEFSLKIWVSKGLENTTEPKFFPIISPNSIIPLCV